MFARRTLTALLPVAALLTSACTEDASAPEPGLPITTAEAAQTAEANLSALIGAVIDQADVVAAQPRHAWMLAMMGESDAEDLSEAMQRPQAEAMRDDLMWVMREKLLVEANLEPAVAGEPENALTYRLPADVKCSAEAAAEGECSPLPDSTPIRVQVVSHAEGQLELSALLGPNRHNVATLTLTAAAADLSVDLGELRAAAEELPEEDRDDIRRKIPIAEGVVDFSLDVDAGAVTFGAAVVEALHVRAVPDPGSYDVRVEPAAFTARLDSAYIVAALEFNGATLDLDGFEPFGSAAPAAITLAPAEAQFGVDLMGASLEAKLLPSVAQFFTLRQGEEGTVTYTAKAEGDAPLGGVFAPLDAAAHQVRFTAFSAFSFVAERKELVIDGEHAPDGEVRIELSDAAAPALLHDAESGVTTLEAGRLTYARIGEAPTSLVPGECGVTQTRMSDEWLGEVLACPAE
jgi:hypothetical protein